jgi:hypothetical protein
VRISICTQKLKSGYGKMLPNCSSADSERGFEKERVVYTFCPHSLTSEQTEDRVSSCQDIIAMAEVVKNVLTKLVREMSPGVLLMNPKQSVRFLNGLVRYPLARKN